LEEELKLKDGRTARYVAEMLRRKRREFVTFSDATSYIEFRMQRLAARQHARK
jgi:transcriptional antiterminator Rof (Rho-off)